MIVCKSPLEIEKMRRGGLLLWELLNELRAMAAPGLSTFDLEKVAAERIAQRGAQPAFKGYYEYPCVLCTSINNEIVHGIPSPRRILKEGDILKIDMGVKTEGYYSDSALTVAVERYVEPHGYSVVRDFVGHGIGSQLHEDPKVPNYGTPGHGPKLKEGMVLAIEPMVNTGTHKTRILEDKWTAVTEDGGYSAHFEHCVVVTKNGPWILTKP